MIQVKQATSFEDFRTIEQLAREIFPAVYSPLMDPAHVTFFINRFQTSKAIAQQIATDHYHYYLLCLEQQITGYLGVQLRKNVLHLSKLYILEAYRGNKIGKTALQFTDELAHKNGCSTIDLYVNKHNADTIQIYQKAGYIIQDLVAHTYDNGHTEEDYHMVKTLS
ncbi:MAG TPA: N-acetyltransferase [Microscillaceae bacterium]|nr:N-acetyltransferase [Microscillaceae bacterium]